MSFLLYTFTIRGVVQGVGFRPYIRNACMQAGLVGYVQNIGEGVSVVVNKKRVFENILDHIPVTAEIQSVSVVKKEVGRMPKSFVIRKSFGEGFAEIPPDFFVCDDCLREVRDPTDRRFGYFFTTCTHCGPRLSMTRKSPYDRETTSMREFLMCKECRREYTDPENRRYHAQTIACHQCGPALTFLSRDTSGVSVRGPHALRLAVEKIREGNIVAIKGNGGFHLMCLAVPETVRALKTLTGRTDKPFALLCKDIAMAKSIAYIAKEERALLISKERPIVICTKKKALPEVSELDTVGILLPYTALQYLLFESIKTPLVCTSSNVSGHPITTEARKQCAPFTLTHSRKIVHSMDDSLVKVIQKKPLFIRRSRGYVPRSLPMREVLQKTILAFGAERNATFCIARDGRVTLSPYMGNTAHASVLKRYENTLQSFLSLMHAKPDVLLCDLHPQYATTELAQKLSREWRVPLVRVQHHLAHAYAVALEQGLEAFSAIVCDGLGYGADGTLWGGEVFVGGARVGHLEPQWQLGGDLATEHPDRMLFAIVRNFLSQKEMATLFRKRCTNRELKMWEKQLEAKINTIQTSSCGRVLDAAAVLLGFPAERTYDGRAAMNLESFATTPYILHPVIQDHVLLTTPLFQFLVQNLDRDHDRLAATVFRYLAEGLHAIASQYALPITFSGGCAYNTYMTTYLLERGVLVNKNVPPGDGGISFGQVAWYSLTLND